MQDIAGILKLIAREGDSPLTSAKAVCQSLSDKLEAKAVALICHSQTSTLVVTPESVRPYFEQLIQANPIERTDRPHTWRTDEELPEKAREFLNTTACESLLIIPGKAADQHLVTLLIASGADCPRRVCSPSELSELEVIAQALSWAFAESETSYPSRLSTETAATTPAVNDSRSKADAEEAAQYLQAIIDASPEAIGVYQWPSCRLIQTNQRMLDMFGYTPEEASELTLQDIATDSEPYTWKDAFRWLEKLHLGERPTFEWSTKDKSGNTFWVEVTLKGTLTGSKHHLVVFAHDITERKARQQKLSELIAFNQTIIDNSPVGILVYEAAGQCVLANAAAAKAVGTTVDVLLSQNFFEIASWKECGLLDTATECLASNLPRYQMICIETSFGRKGWFDSYLTTFSRNDIPHLLVLINDGTEQHKIREDLCQANERFQLVASATNDVIWDRNLLSNELWFSSTMNTLTGHCVPGPVDSTAWWQAKIHPEDRTRILVSIEDCIKNHLTDWSGEYRFLLADGSWAHFYDRGQILHDKSGQATRMVGSVMDITRLKQIQEELQEALLRLENVNSTLENRVSERTAQLVESNRKLSAAKASAEKAARTKSDFLSNMSHEIRTPLNAIVGFLTLIGQSPLTGKQQNYLAKARAASAGLLQIISDILDISKIESGKLRIEDVDFELDRLLNNLINLHTPAAVEKSLELIVTLAPDTPINLKGDPVRLSQVLTNLVSNAIKFTASGSVELTVQSLQQDTTGALLEFSVHDTGIGLSDIESSRVMEPFVQADSSITRIYGGSGLGLTISSQILNHLDSHLEVESKLGDGSTFKFAVYLEFSSAVDLLLNSSALGSIKALVIEGNQKIRERMVSQLQLIGTTVDSAVSGEEGVEIATAPGSKYDLVLVGQSLTEHSALEIGKVIHHRSLSNGSHIPRIIITTSRFSSKTAGLAEDYPTILRPLSSKVVRELVQSTQTKDKDCFSSFPRYFSNKKVLLVEDNAINREVLLDLLSGEGINVVSADNGKQAVELICNQALNPDLILMDIQMPVMDGLEATQLIRAYLGAASPPIVALTAHVFQDEIKQCLDAGMVDHLSKPLDPGQLKVLLSSWLSGTQETGNSAATITTAANVSQAEEIALLDSADGLHRLGGVQDSYRRILQLFFEDYTRVIPDWKQLLEAGNWEELRQNTHSLKGAAGFVGAKQLVASCREVESAILGSSADTQAHAVEALLNILEDTLEAIRCYLEAIPLR